MHCSVLIYIYRRRNPDSSHTADVQRLLNLASQLCNTGSDSAEPHQPPPCAEHELDSEYVLFDAQSPHELQTTTGNTVRDGDQDYVTATECDDDDEAFWSQAANMVEERGWEEGKGEEGEEVKEEEEDEGDSAFIDGLLLSGLIRTPQMSIPQSHHVIQHHSTPHTSHPSSCTTPHTNHPSPCTAPHHSTPPTKHPSSSSTPVSHRHAVSNKPHIHPLF